MKARTVVSCKNCNKDFKPLLTEVKRGGGKFCGRPCFFKTRSRAMRGANNPQWKENVSYRTIHQWVERQLGKPSKCEHCSRGSGLFDWANISGEYSRDTKDWVRLCKPCHHDFDGWNTRAWITRRKRYGKSGKKSITLGSRDDR